MKMSSLRVLVIALTLISISESKIKPNGKAVMITGCDTGFGNELAKRLNQLGFKVYATVLDRNSAGALDLIHNTPVPNKLFITQMDVSKDADVSQVFENIKQELSSSGHELWALVNNAGIGSYSPLEWGPADRFKKVFDVNVFGMVRVTRTFLPLIRASKGRIINILSMLSRFTAQMVGVYSMSKHSALAFSDILRQEISRFGVRVITIEPAIVKTGLTQVAKLENTLEQFWNQSSPEVRQSYGSLEPEKKITELIFESPFVEQNTNGVIDDMIDSIISLTPKHNYNRAHILYQIIQAIHIYLPTEFSDWIVETGLSLAQVLM